MICKKCGRECGDDMLRCLWCNTPNEGHVDPKDSAPPNFEGRAQKAIFWLRFFFIGLAVLAIPTEISVATHGGNDNYFGELLKGFFFSGLFGIFAPFIILRDIFGTKDVAGGLYVIGFTINHILLFVHLFVTSWITVHMFCSWLRSAIREQSRFTETNYPPKTATVLALAPIIFPAFHYQIFKDLFTRQKESLKKNNLEANVIPDWMLRAIPILGVAIQVGWSLGLFISKGLIAIRVISLLLCIALLFCYTKVIKAITANLSTLNSLSTSDTPSTPPDEEPHHEELSEEAVTRDENS